MVGNGRVLKVAAVTASLLMSGGAAWAAADAASAPSHRAPRVAEVSSSSIDPTSTSRSDATTSDEETSTSPDKTSTSPDETSTSTGETSTTAFADPPSTEDTTSTSIADSTTSTVPCTGQDSRDVEDSQGDNQASQDTTDGEQGGNEASGSADQGEAQSTQPECDHDTEGTGGDVSDPNQVGGDHHSGSTTSVPNNPASSPRKSDGGQQDG